MNDSSETPSTVALFRDVTGDHLTPDDLDAILACLSHRRRRLVVEYVSDAQEPVVVDELVDHILNEESNGGTTTASGTDEHEVRIALYHNHLPRLSGAEVVTREQETSTLRAGDHLSVATAVLDAIQWR